MKYYGISLFLHLLILLGLLIHGAKAPNFGNSKEKPKGFKGGNSGSIIPKVIDIQVIKTPRSNEKGPGKDRTPSSKVCNDSYGGIGIMDNFATGKIELIAPGYPADRAGLLIGDRILKVQSNEGSDIRGPVGTKVTLLIMRGSPGKVFSVTMIREKICTEGKI